MFISRAGHAGPILPVRARAVAAISGNQHRWRPIREGSYPLVWARRFNLLGARTNRLPVTNNCRPWVSKRCTLYVLSCMRHRAENTTGGQKYTSPCASSAVTGASERGLTPYRYVPSQRLGLRMLCDTSLIIPRSGTDPHTTCHFPMCTRGWPSPTVVLGQYRRRVRICRDWWRRCLNNGELPPASPARGVSSCFCAFVLVGTLIL